jgi:hypothetical protein
VVQLRQSFLIAARKGYRKDQLASFDEDHGLEPLRHYQASPKGADQLMASENKLRVLIIGLCMWLFRYLVLEGLETPLVSGTLLVDMLGDSSSKMRAQSRWSFSRVREGLIDAFSHFESSGRFEGSEEAWSYIERQLASRPKFEEFYRELGLRSGLAQPRANRISAKHFELQPETLRAAVMSVVAIDDGFVPITERQLDSTD